MLCGSKTFIQSNIKDTGRTTRANMARKAAMVSSETASKWNGLVAKHTNTATYGFLITGLQTGYDFTKNGPANTGSGCRQSTCSYCHKICGFDHS